ncbi:MAG: MFS transporter [Neisseriaceae bacterium]
MKKIGVGLGFIALVITYLDRSIFSYAILPIEKTFNLTNAEFGLISSAFGFGYLLTVIAGGILADKYGARKIWAICALCWSIICMFFSLAFGFWDLFILRLLLGASEAPVFPTFMRVIVDWIPINKRSKIFALGSSSVAFSSVIGAPLTTYLITIFGWRNAFLFLGIPGIIWALVWFIFYRDQTKLIIQSSARKRHVINWKFLLRTPTLIANNGAFFVFAYIQFFALIWLPGYLQQVYHVKLMQVGWFLTIPWITAGVFLIGGGVLTDWLLQKTKSLRISRSHLIWVCQLLAAVCFFLVVSMNSFLISIVFLSLGIGFNNMPSSVMGIINADLDPNNASTSNAIMNFTFGIASIVSPIVNGFLTTWTGNFNVAILLMILLVVASVLGIVFFHRPDRDKLN